MGTVKPGIAMGHDHFGNLVYADDTAFFIKSTAEAVSSLNSFSETASALGLRVSWLKMKLRNLGIGTQPPPIVLDGNTADSVNNFVYLGSFDGYSRTDINRRIGLASSVMSALRHIWKDRCLSLTTKTCIYQALMLSVLLYAAKT